MSLHRRVYYDRVLSLFAVTKDKYGMKESNVSILRYFILK